MLDSEVKESSEDEVDFDYDDQNQKFFDIASVKPLDLKSQWLGNTNEVIKTFESGYKKL